MLLPILFFFGITHLSVSPVGFTFFVELLMHMGNEQKIIFPAMSLS